MSSTKFNGNVPRKDNNVKDEWSAYENYGAGHGKNNHVCVHIHNNIHIFYNPGNNLCSIDRVISASNNKVINLGIFQNEGRDVQDIGRVKNNFHFNNSNELYRDIGLLVLDSWFDSSGANVQGWDGAGCISDMVQRYFTTSSCNKSGVNCSHNCAPSNDAIMCGHTNQNSRLEFASSQQNTATNRIMLEDFSAPRNNNNKEYLEKEHSTNKLNFYDNDSSGKSSKLTEKYHQFSNNHGGSRIAVLKKKGGGDVKLQSAHRGGPHEGGKHTQIVNIPPGNYLQDRSDCAMPKLESGKRNLSYNSAIDAFVSGEYVSCEEFRCEVDGLQEHSNIGGFDCAYNFSDTGKRSNSFGKRKITQGNLAHSAATKCSLTRRDKWDNSRKVQEQGEILSPRKWCEVVSFPSGNNPEGNGTWEKIEKGEFQKNSIDEDTNGGEKMTYSGEEVIKKVNLSGTHHGHIPEEKKKKKCPDSENGSYKLNGGRKGGNGSIQGIKIKEKSNTAQGCDDNLIYNWAFDLFEDGKLSYDRVCKFDDSQNCLNGSGESFYTNGLIKSGDSFHKSCTNKSGGGCRTNDPKGSGNIENHDMESRIRSIRSEKYPRGDYANSRIDNSWKEVLPGKGEEYFYFEQNGWKEDNFYLNSHNFERIFNKSASEKSSHGCYGKDLHNGGWTESPFCKNDKTYNENICTREEDTYVEKKKKNICEEKIKNAKIDMLKKTTAYDQVPPSNRVFTDAYINKQINAIFGDLKKDGDLSKDNIAQLVHGSSVRETNFLFRKSIDMEIETKENMKYNPTTLLGKNQFSGNNFSHGNYDNSKKLNGDNNNRLTFNVAQYFLEDSKHDNFSCKSINVGPYGSRMFTTATTVEGQGQGNDLHDFLHFCDQSQVGSKAKEFQLYDLLENYDRSNYTIPNEKSTQDEFVEIYDSINGTGRKETKNINDEFLEISQHEENSILHVEDEFVHIREKSQSSGAGPQEDEFVDIYDKIVSANSAQVDEFLDICGREERFQQLRQGQQEHGGWGEEVVGNAERKCVEKADHHEGGKSGQSEQSDKQRQSGGNHFTSSYNARKKVRQSELPDPLEDFPQGNKSSMRERLQSYSSFTYASGKEVNINKDVLNRMRKKLFGDDDDDEGERCITGEAIPTEGSTEVRPSDSNNSSFRSVNLSSEGAPTRNGKEHKSFTYASGKEVNINKDVLNRMRETLFGDEGVVSGNTNNSSNNISNSSKSGNNDIVGMKEKQLGSFAYASGKKISIDRDVLNRMRETLFGDDEHHKDDSVCTDNLRERKKHVDLNIRNGDKIANRNEHQLEYARLTLAQPSGGEEDGGVKEGEEAVMENQGKGKLSEFKDPESKGIKVECTQKSIPPGERNHTGVTLHEGGSVKEGELYESDGYNEIINTQMNLLHNTEYKGTCAKGRNVSKKRVGRQMLRSDVKGKNNFVNPRKRKLSVETGRAEWVHERGRTNHKNKMNITSFGKRNKELDLNLNLRDHLKLIRDIYTLLAKGKKLKGNRRLTNTLIYLNENKRGYTFNWYANDYLYFLKNEELNEYYTADVSILYELFVLITKQLNIFHSYDFSWFSKKYKLVTMTLVRRYKKDLRRRYRILRDGVSKDRGQKFPPPKYPFYTCKFGQRMGRSTQSMLTLQIIDEVEPPCPIEFMFKLLKRYVEERKNKKSILQKMQDNAVSCKVPVNLRVEKIIKSRGNQFVLILSDNFEYIYCTAKDSYLKKIIKTNIIKEGNVLRINALDLHKQTENQTESELWHKGVMLCTLSSNDLVEVDRQNNLKVGMTKYRAKRIKHIEHCGNSCFFVDVIIISKSEFSYGFYDSVKGKYYLLPSNVYEKIIYNLKHEMSELLQEENFQEDDRYTKVKDDLNMFLEATSFCTVHAIDFAACERIRGWTSLDDKIEHVINSLCRVKLFRMDMETYENLQRGKRIQLFNVHVQKLGRNNKFSQVVGEDMEDFIYETFQGENIADQMKRAVNYNSFESHFFKEEMESRNGAREGSYRDDYLDGYTQNPFRGFLKRGKKYTPIILQGTQATYINVDDKYRSKLFEELNDMVILQNNAQGNRARRESQIGHEGKEQQICYPAFIYTNVFKIPVLSRIHMDLLRNYAKINGRGRSFYYDLIQGNFYTLSGVIVHYTDVEMKEVTGYACPEGKKNNLFYQVFLLTSNGNLCCVNISMISPDSLISTYRKDFECKEREMIKRMIDVRHVDPNGEKGEHKKGQGDNKSVGSSSMNNLYSYLYKVERKNRESASEEDVDSKNIDVFIFFKDVEFINYDEKYDIYNFRSYNHPHFQVPRLYSNEFEYTRRSIAELIRGKYIECEKNRLVVKLTGSLKIKIGKDNLPHMHFFYLLIYSKSKSIELTGVHVKDNYLSTFLENMWTVFVK
ncbi:conserved Plasmodium protein, unknown function [Plasmodium knowlesi strain H]|uniref:Uncharacterized protein n=3 Tax=Plasmodium knowlesi TaxID=5850 RepID=A0A5K1UBX1_PLAKH|nr:conserved Plasmodium protein, unknown function [Plasmodium knowlesi strain H]OTN65702.1 Uncharacterized protein PKNOH_S110070900 [Plasmodium knowlesi]CAA9989330.1 conserved Plasmodium protein, unknown function [Plasmodium knowlesi strain H]SBO24893.1 conserved Plasmodium protein, unknown function [Plasmodium knowlesi strain H]SBO27942.1 conserved Plasmodium protein, unknown function [Plasmodium knowlesi strain H]VVS78804.1 conserved Plasmodium protein, unknown function [Plasmodium knowlesi |eukprot:XP_002260058.1 hypothetical protein, conserved in Plasmodium species [Plasmodium knowlesi strain H]